MSQNKVLKNLLDGDSGSDDDSSKMNLNNFNNDDDYDSELIIPKTSTTLPKTSDLSSTPMVPPGKGHKSDNIYTLTKKGGEPKKNKVIFFQEIAAKDENTSSTTTESSESSSSSSSEDTIILSQKEKQFKDLVTKVQKEPVKQQPLQKPQLLNNIKTPQFRESFISNGLNNKFNTKLSLSNNNTNIKNLNYRDQLKYNASENGNAFGTSKKKEQYYIPLKSSKDAKKALNDLKLPYHCHMKGMCTGQKKCHIHELVHLQSSFINNIMDDLNNLQPEINSDELSLYLFKREYSDMKEERFVMMDEEIFSQQVTTYKYDIQTDYGNHILIFDITNKPKFDDFFKDNNQSKIIKLDFYYPAKDERMHAFFYFQDTGKMSDFKKYYIHKSAENEMVPTVIFGFKRDSLMDDLVLTSIWILYHNPLILGVGSSSTKGQIDISSYFSKKNK